MPPRAGPRRIRVDGSGDSSHCSLNVSNPATWEPPPPLRLITVVISNALTGVDKATLRVCDGFVASVRVLVRKAVPPAVEHAFAEVIWVWGEAPSQMSTTIDPEAPPA